MNEFQVGGQHRVLRGTSLDRLALVGDAGTGITQAGGDLLGHQRNEFEPMRILDHILDRVELTRLGVQGNQPLSVQEQQGPPLVGGVVGQRAIALTLQHLVRDRFEQRGELRPQGVEIGGSQRSGGVQDGSHGVLS